VKIVITGGAGYIGSKLTKLLLACGHEVKVLDLCVVSSPLIIDDDRFKFYAGDIRDLALVKNVLKDADVLFHFAFLSNDPDYKLDKNISQCVNIDAFSAIIKLAYDLGVSRIVFPSSCSIYGKGAESDKSSMFCETRASEPLTDYAAAKVECEKILLDLPIRKNLVCTILRLATVYGASDSMRLDLLINRMVLEALQKKKISVKAEHRIRPVLCIDDLCALYLKVLACDSSLVNREVFNVAYENNTLLESTNIVASALGLPVERSDEFMSDNRSYRVSSKKIENRLNFYPKYTISSYLHLLVDKISNLINSPDFDLGNYTNINKQQRYFS
jgi:nucleoside-diphosphate-sugar epimerase